MRGARPAEAQARAAVDRPRWSVVLQALREARGVTQEGWAARLGVSLRTVQRWERGERVPDPGAEAGLLAYCGERGLFRTYDRGSLAGLSLTAESLQALLAEARLSGNRQPALSAAEGSALGSRATTPSSVLSPQSSNLPALTSSFVGREPELAAVRRVLGGTRLLTLTGAGGCGKTRLALELAGELLWAYPHGVWFVELAALVDPALAPETVATALGLRTTGPQPVIAVLVDHLAPRHLLLVLDNCEHLLPACAALVETLLRACPHLAVLATSREALRVPGETIWRVPPLSPTDAGRLLIERARLYQPDFAVTGAGETVVAEICDQLDGIPLAIELAAARVKTLSVAQIAERLSDRFRLLTDGSRTALPRQQTLRATLDWSYDLLTALEQALLRRLSVFAGGFALEAAEAVGADLPPRADLPLRPPSLKGRGSPGRPTPASVSPFPSGRGAGGVGLNTLDTLTHLVDKSLVIAHQHDRAVRYGLLETVRQYAGERLDEAGETASARRRHRAWYLALAEQAEPELLGPEQAAWLTRLEQEHDNLRAALAWSLAQGEGEVALRLAGSSARFWERRGHLSEGRQWLAQALAASADTPAEARAKALHSSGVLTGLQGDYAAARSLYETSLTLYRDLEHAQGIAEAQGNLGRIIVRQGEHAEARPLLEASLALHRELGNKPGVASVLGTLGQLALRQGNYAEARALFEARLALQRELGNTEGIADALEDLATVAGEQGDADRQVALLDESLALFREIGSKGGIALVLGNLGIAAWTRGEYDRALALLQESLTLYREVGDRRGIARLLGNQAFLMLYQRDFARAEALCRESLTLYRDAGDAWGIGRYLPVLAGAAFGQGQPERAARLFGAGAALRERFGTPLPPVVQPGHDRAVAAVGEVLGDKTFEAAWAGGQALSLEAAVASALAEGEPA